MSIPFSASGKSLHEQAIENVILATDAAYKDQGEQVKMHIQQAKTFAELTARKMRAMGLHRQSDEYIASLNEHMNRVWSILQKIHQEHTKEKLDRAKKVSGDIRKDADACICKSTPCTCGGMDQKLTKGFNSPFMGASPARVEHFMTGKLTPNMGKPGQVQGQAKYHYKPLHELSPKQQGQVKTKYAGDHAKYSYPVHPESGELVHAQRVPLPAGTALRARQSSYGEARPEHTPGQSVKINSPGHGAHGRTGVVMNRHKELPNKIAVNIGPTADHTIYVNPHEVVPHAPKTRVEKAIQTIFNIRKAFMK